MGILRAIPARDVINVPTTPMITPAEEPSNRLLRASCTALIANTLTMVRAMISQKTAA